MNDYCRFKDSVPAVLLYDHYYFKQLYSPQTAYLSFVVANRTLNTLNNKTHNILQTTNTW